MPAQSANNVSLSVVCHIVVPMAELEWEAMRFGAETPAALFGGSGGESG